MSEKDNNQTAVERMWKATGAFMHSLNDQPGWPEWFLVRRLRFFMSVSPAPCQA